MFEKSVMMFAGLGYFVFVLEVFVLEDPVL